MATITPYEQQVLPQGTLAAPQATSAQFGFGQGVSDFGQGVQQGASAVHQKQEEEAQFKAATTAMDIMSQQKEALADMKKNVPADPVEAAKYISGMTENFKQQFQGIQDNAVQSMPTRRSQQALELKLKSMKASMIDDVMTFQAGQEGALFKNRMEGTFGRNQNLVFSDPASLPTMLDAEKQAIDAAPIRGDLKASLLNDRKQTLNDAAMQGSVQSMLNMGKNVPVEAIKEFRDGLLDGSNNLAERVSPQVYKQTIHTLTSMLNTRAAEDAKLQYDGLSEKIDERQFGVNNGLTKADAAFIPDPAARAKAEKAIDTAIVTGDATAVVEAASFSDLQALAASDRNKLMEPGEFSKDKTVAAARMNAIQARMKQEEDDFAGYAMKTSPSVKAAYEGMVQGNYSQAAVQNYVSTAAAEQQRLNPMRQTTLLPRGQADALAADIAGRIQKGEGPGEVLAAEATKWGKSWPTVFGQIGGKLPPDAFNIASGMRAADANYLATLSTLKAEELKRGVDSSQLSGLDATVATKFRDFTHSMSGLPGGDAIVSKIMASNEKMVYGYMRQGFSVNDAVAKSYDALVGHKYEFSGNLRIPKSENASAVAGGAAQILSRIDQVPLAIPPMSGVRPEDSKRQWQRDVKANGVWFANQDETGAALYIKDQSGIYTSVRDDKGQPIEYTWKSLSSKSQLWWWQSASSSDLAPDVRPPLQSLVPAYKGQKQAVRREGKQ